MFAELFFCDEAMYLLTLGTSVHIPWRAMALKHGPTVQSTLVTIRMERSMGKVHTHGLMAHSTKASGSKALCMAMVIINGKMERNTMDNGRIISWMDMDI